jgi:predicted dehydrogenase
MQSDRIALNECHKEDLDMRDAKTDHKDGIVRFGILGNAWIARDFVIPAMLSSETCKVAGIASRKLLPLDFLPEIRHYQGYDELLDDPEIDAVYIPLPNALHCEWSIRAMRKGKHVLCEKPIAMNARECEEMMQASKDNHVILMEAFMYRYSDRMEQLESVLDSGILGQIRGMHSDFGYTLDWDSPARQDPALGGGSLYDVGCYCIDCMNLVMRHEGASFADAGATFRKQGGVDYRASGWLLYSNGVTATFDCWFDAHPHQEITLVGTKGVLSISDPFHETPAAMTITTSEGTRLIDLSPTPTYKLEAEAFAAAVLGQSSRLVALEETLATMRVLDRLYSFMK